MAPETEIEEGNEDDDETPTNDETADLRAQLAAAKLELQKHRENRARSLSTAQGKRRRPESDEQESEEELMATPGIGLTYLEEEAPRISNRIKAAYMNQEKTFRPAEPKEYNGGSIADAREFIRRCEGVFTMQPHIYWFQYDKYQYARTRLAGRVANNWETQVQHLLPQELTWVTLKTWLVDQVQDPNNRSITYLIRLFNHKQRDHQRVDDYATYLENAVREVEMEPLTETQAMCLLIAGVKEELRNKLLEQQNIPYSRTELLPLLTRLENGMRTRNAGSERRAERAPRRELAAAPPRKIETHKVETTGTRLPERPAWAATAARQRPGFLTHPNTTPNQGVSRPGACFNCNEFGHFSRECKKPKKAMP